MSFFLISNFSLYQLNVIARHEVTMFSSGCPLVMEFRKTIFQAWKIMENSKGHGKSWKMMIMSWNFYYCIEQFCKSDTTSFIKSNYEPFYLFNNYTTSR